ncbi:hypothetical protein HO173_008051 [Letharia columbiana]|uniref:Uncharacterized protein n=1 Tax=Letharia columbiana TaxID=112416 RepID=A0A8H6FSA9_9LECA|nr:uncharacterized protein HO173_008051 [Letharia columbiana]KAF6233839.1 hypothetical protein HO173_008051 [Letharia columbiana]
MAFFPTTPGLSFYSIPIAWILSLVPHVFAVKTYEAASSRKFDNTQPRSLTNTVASDQSLSKATKDTIIRAEGAQQNGFENLGIFAAGVVAGNAAGLDAGYLNALSMAYIASRVVYNLVYINNTTLAVANVRSVVYVGSSALIFTMYVSAGLKMREVAGG